MLVVSHNMGVITSLCGTALWLERGAIHEIGAPHAVVGGLSGITMTDKMSVF